MSDEAMILGAVAALAAAAYARTAGDVPQAVIHRTGSTVLGIGGLGFALFVAAVTIEHLMSGNLHRAGDLGFAVGIAAVTCLALAGWSVLCGVGGAWRARWIVAGVVLGVMAGGAGYVGNKVSTTAAAKAQAASEIRLAQDREQAKARQLSTNEIVIHTPNGNTIHFPAGTSLAEMRRAVEGLDRAVQRGVLILEGDEIRPQNDQRRAR